MVRRKKAKIEYLSKVPANVKKASEKLADKVHPKYKRIQVGTIASFWLKGIRKEKFVSITTMHIARLLKR